VAGRPPAAARTRQASSPLRNSPVRAEPATDVTPTEKHHGSFLRELPVIVITALVISMLIKTFLFQAFFIRCANLALNLASLGATTNWQ